MNKSFFEHDFEKKSKVQLHTEILDLLKVTW